MDRLDQLRQEIQTFIRERDWEKFHTGKDLAISLTLEAAEVLELFQWEGSDLCGHTGKPAALADELADVFYWVILLSDRYDVDLTAALRQKLEKNREKYPIEKAHGKSTKYTKL